MATLVDANVVLDVATKDPTWLAWSQAAMEAERRRGPLIVNPIIYAEAAANFATPADLDAVLFEALIARELLPFEAAFPASRAFLAYRRRGGARTTPLPDFFIGAHAEVAEHRLLTRDRGRFATYFPAVTLVAP